MRKASQSVIFISTSPPAERVELLQPLTKIENMDDDSEEIQSGGLLKRYVERPKCMQNVTLADWAAWYDGCGQKSYTKTNEKTDFDDLQIENEDGLNDDEILNVTPDVMPTISKSIKKRSQARIIGRVWFNREAKPEKCFRELLMLLNPWRNEGTDLLKNYSSYEEHYMNRREKISKQMQQYVCNMQRKLE